MTPRVMNKREESLYQSGYDLGEARFKQKVREAINKLKLMTDKREIERSDIFRMEKDLGL